MIHSTLLRLVTPTSATFMPNGGNYLSRLRERLKSEYEQEKANGGWRTVGDNNGISGGMAYRIVNQGYEPKDDDIRDKLGLPNNIQHPDELRCACGKWFTPNSPKRRKCYDCEKIRRRK